MAREIVVELQGAVSRFGLSRVSRDKLYGTKRKIVVDEHGETCVAAALTRDGAALLPPGSTTQLYVDGAFDVVDRKELKAVGPDGEDVHWVKGTLGEEQPLRGPVPARRVLDCVTTAVYQLDPAELDEGLRKALDQGGIFETRFSYRGGYTANPLFLLQSDEGIFALVGQETAFEPLSRERVDDDDDDDPFDEDTLDFAMF